MRYILTTILFVLIFGACSLQSTETKTENVEACVKEESATSKHNESVSKESNNTTRKDDEFIDGVKCEMDTFMIKNAPRNLDWMRIEEIVCELNNWKYSDNTEYVLKKILFRDESGCRGDTIFAFRNGLKIFNFSNDVCGDMYEEELDYYYENGSIGYVELNSSSFGGFYKYSETQKSLFSKNRELLCESICKISEYEEVIDDDNEIEYDRTISYSYTKGDVNVNYSIHGDTMFVDTIGKSGGVYLICDEDDAINLFQKHRSLLLPELEDVIDTNLLKKIK